MNSQPMRKQALRINGDLDIHSIFETIQGEGPYVGRPAVFVRLFGCTLMCPGCDTDYTSHLSRSSPSMLEAEISQFRKNLIVITGGEPFRQNITPLVVILLSAGYTVQIETNGTVYCPGPWNDVTIVCSPKSGKINKLLAECISAFKYVIQAGFVDPLDGLPTSALMTPEPPARPPYDFPHRQIYVQPFDEKDPIKNKANLEACIKTVMKHDYTLCLQTHKIIGVD